MATEREREERTEATQEWQLSAEMEPLRKNGPDGGPEYLDPHALERVQLAGMWQSHRASAAWHTVLAERRVSLDSLLM